MKTNVYKKTWLAFVNIKAKNEFDFNELIDREGLNTNDDFKGAWANIIVKTETIQEAINLIQEGLSELNFSVVFIDKIENLKSLIEHKQVTKTVIGEVDWLLDSRFVFKISDKIFPYE
ncbi:MAG: hypothetical protein KF900_08140 [Bacteroidetes bacterium]|nr:hypothetical protein [Bacteroidota bacterium]